jgi:hypothetical protein
MAAGPELHAQLVGIMERFAADAGVTITAVPDGAVQAVREAGDFGSMRSRQGHYEIEQSVYDDDVRLRKELIHQITAYYGSRISPEDWRDWQSPVMVDRTAADWLEDFVDPQVDSDDWSSQSPTPPAGSP